MLLMVSVESRSRGGGHHAVRVLNIGSIKRTETVHQVRVGSYELGIAQPLPTGQRTFRYATTSGGTCAIKSITQFTDTR